MKRLLAFFLSVAICLNFIPISQSKAADFVYSIGYENILSNYTNPNSGMSGTIMVSDQPTVLEIKDLVKTSPDSVIQTTFKGWFYKGTKVKAIHLYTSKSQWAPIDVNGNTIEILEGSQKIVLKAEYDSGSNITTEVVTTTTQMVTTTTEVATTTQAATTTQVVTTTTQMATTTQTATTTQVATTTQMSATTQAVSTTTEASSSEEIELEDKINVIYTNIPKSATNPNPSVSNKSFKLKNITCKEYIFLGWYDGDTKVTEVTESMTLKAKWVSKPELVSSKIIKKKKNIKVKLKGKNHTGFEIKYKIGKTYYTILTNKTMITLKKKAKNIKVRCYKQVNGVKYYNS